MIRMLAASVLLLVAGFVVTSWYALEAGGVAVIETRTPSGSPRSTHVWFVEPQGELWLEAGTPENGWYRDVQRDPAIRFSSDRRSGRYVAQPSTDAGAHAQMRARLREKYGFRDRWVGFFIDNSKSVAVRLLEVPEDPAEEAALGSRDAR